MENQPFLKMYLSDLTKKWWFSIAMFNRKYPVWNATCGPCSGIKQFQPQLWSAVDFFKDPNGQMIFPRFPAESAEIMGLSPTHPPTRVHDP